MYNFNTGNIKQGVDSTNMLATYTIDDNGKKIDYSIIFTFDKNNICINARAVISGYKENELINFKRTWENSVTVSNIKIEQQKLYINDNIYVGKEKENILESLKEYDAKIVEI